MGGRTVRELNEGRAAASEGMDVEEFIGWVAYFALEPPLEARLDAQTAMLLAQQHNMNRGRGKPARPAKSFLPRWFTPPATPEQSMERNLQALKATYLAMRGDPERIG